MDSWVTEWEDTLKRHESELAQLAREAMERYDAMAPTAPAAVSVRTAAREAHRATLLVRAAVMGLPEFPDKPITADDEAPYGRCERCGDPLSKQEDKYHIGGCP